VCVCVCVRVCDTVCTCVRRCVCLYMWARVYNILLSVPDAKSHDGDGYEYTFSNVLGGHLSHPVLLYVRRNDDGSF